MLVRELHVLVLASLLLVNCVPPPPSEPVPGYEEALCYLTSTSPVCQSLMRSWPAIQANKVSMNYSSMPFSVVRVEFERPFGQVVPRVVCSVVNVPLRAKPIIVTVRTVRPGDMTLNVHSVQHGVWDEFTLQYLAWDPKLTGDPVDLGIYRGEGMLDYTGGRVQTLEVHFPKPFAEEPRVIATTHIGPRVGQFALESQAVVAHTIKRVWVGGFVINLFRVDASWALPQLKINYVAFDGGLNFDHDMYRSSIYGSARLFGGETPGFIKNRPWDFNVTFPFRIPSNLPFEKVEIFTTCRNDHNRDTFAINVFKADAAGFSGTIMRSDRPTWESTTYIDYIAYLPFPEPPELFHADSLTLVQDTGTYGTYFIKVDQLQDLRIDVVDITYPSAAHVNIQNGLGVEIGSGPGALDVYVSNLVTYPNHADKKHVMWSSEHDIHAENTTQHQHHTIEVFHSDRQWGGRADWDRGFNEGKYFIGIHARRPSRFVLSVALSFTWTILFNRVYRGHAFEGQWQYYRVIPPENIAATTVVVRQLVRSRENVYEGLTVWAREGARPGDNLNASLYEDSEWSLYTGYIIDTNNLVQPDNQLKIDFPDRERAVYTLELPKMTASVPYYIGVYLREDTIDADGDNPTANLTSIDFDIQVLDGRAPSQFALYPDSDSDLYVAHREIETPYRRQWQTQRHEGLGEPTEKAIRPGELSGGTFLGAERGTCEDLGTCELQHYQTGMVQSDHYG